MAVMVRTTKSAQTPSSEISRRPFCTIFALIEYGNNNLSGASHGSFCVVLRAGRGGGIDNAGDGGRRAPEASFG
eukprot:15460753-Alexandrium_andersonii.AAC.1